jgi:hypothetical protein
VPAVSLAVVLKGPEGIVLAADSRVTLTSVQPVEGTNQVHVLPTYFDNATKLMGLQNHEHLAIVTYGSGSIGVDQPRMVHGYIPEFEAHLADAGNNGEPLTVERAAQELGAFFAQRWNEAAMPKDTDPMAFLVAGYDDGEAYGKVYEVSVPNAPQPVEQFAGDFAIAWRGQPYLLERLLNGYAPMAVQIAQEQLNLTDADAIALAQRWQAQLGLPIPIASLPLQDAIDLATFLVNMTATVMTWTVGIQGVGGQVDVATITRSEGFHAIETKKLHPFE